MTIHTLHTDHCGCERADVAPGLLALDDALGVCRAHVMPLLDTVVVSLAEAAGRSLAEPVHSAVNAPPFTNSAVDGFAVAIGDMDGSGPGVLPVSARIAAGDGIVSLQKGTAARIFTGAPLPVGADTVVMQEDTTITEGRVLIQRPVRAGENIRQCGEDMAQGDLVLPAGKRISRRDIGLLAAAGASEVTVRQPVRVALLVTGSEVVDPGQRIAPGQIPDVNGPMLQAVMADPMVEIVTTITIPDTLEDLGSAMAALAQSADLVVTTGGVSVGEEDYLHRAFEAAGGQAHFAGVAVKPGKPISFGQFDNGVHWLGLPGNPTAAYVGWYVFGRAVVSALQGVTRGAGKAIVSSTVAIKHKPGRCELRPARLDGFDTEGRTLASPAKTTQSGRVLPLAQADGLLLIPADAEAMPKGALFEFLPFDDQ